MSALSAGCQLGAYHIVRLLGEGGMGAVYEARQETLERRVALKTLHPDAARNKDAVARFFNEAKVLSQLSHPCIVQVFDFGKAEDGTAYLVMELLRGEPLSHRLRKLVEKQQRLSVLTVLQLAWQIADVLAVAHSQGIVHRDLKPDNLMLVADPIAPGGERVKILDFGIAKLTQRDSRGAVQTDTQAVIGTPMYMSPEQCAGAGGVDAKTDVYSLGCVVYEALAGRPPFVAEGAGELIGRHLFHEPPPLSSLAGKMPSAVAALVHRMLGKDKKKRLGMSDAADELGRLLEKTPGGGQVVRSLTSATTDPDATRPYGLRAVVTTLGQLTGQRTGSSRRLLAALTALFAVAALSVTAFLAWPRSPASSRPAPQTAITTARAAVHWHLDTSPPNAAVFDESGQLLGSTPWTHSAPPLAGKRALRLHRDGYADVYVSLDGSADLDQKLALTRAADTAPAARPSTAPAKPASRPAATRPAAAKPAPPPATATPASPQRATPVKRRIGYEE
jgi:serine/threonine-protein kinase